MGKKNPNQTQFDEYRDWQWIKHLILATYVVPWSVIVGKWSRSIFVVDACAGAGSYTDPDTGATISEGSPVIFAKRAKAYTQERGPGKTMRVFCCEKDHHNYALLAENLRPYTKLVRRRIGRRLLAGQLLLQAARTPALGLALRFGSAKPVQGVLTWALAGA